MKARHFSESYNRSFQTYLSHTNEKQVLFRELLKHFKFDTRSVLDIGAGSGELAIPLSQQVIKYVAIEQKPEYVQRLREAEVFAFAYHFPRDAGKIEGTFDCVLSSHSLPWREEDYRPFIEAMLSLRKPSGALLIVAYSSLGPWSRLREASGDPLSELSRNRLPRLRAWLESLGTLTARLVTTSVNTHTLQELREALAFVYSDGDEAKIETFLANERATEHLRDHHAYNGYYAFPFEHVILELR